MWVRSWKVVRAECAHALGRAGALIGFSSLCGCSFVFVDGPPARDASSSPSSRVDCTTSKAAPVVDTVITTLQIVRTGLAAAAEDSDYDGAPISRGGDIAAGLGFTALFGASAIYGYVVTGKCKEMKGGGRRHRESPLEEPGESWAEPAARGPGPAPAPASAPAPAALAPAPAPAAPVARVCAPGATQRCVGVGACEGGQSCAADGLTWNACECASEPEAAESF